MRHALQLLLLAAVACSQSGPVDPGNTGGPGLKLVAGNNASDTAMTPLASPLTVEVRDASGRLTHGIVVRFDALPNDAKSNGGVYAGTYQALVSPLSGNSWRVSVTDTTDQSGRSGAYVGLGPKAGTAHVVIRVPALALVDTATFTVIPGAPARLAIRPSDTAVTVGHSVALTGTVLDQYLNVVTGSTPTWSSSNQTASVTASGRVSGSAIGNDTITMSVGGVMNFARVSVVPPGRLAVSYGSKIGLADVDGSHVDSLASATEGAAGYRPQWMPDGASLVYGAKLNGVQTLERVDTATRVVTAFFPAGIPAVSQLADPMPTADGHWLFFAAYDSNCSAPLYCLYRSGIDASNPELVGSSALGDGQLQPSPSPDGSMVAFVQGGHIKVYDVANAKETAVDVPGTAPTWSPDGSTIAYVAASGGAIMAMAPDGTGARTITHGESYSGLMMSWSPDGKYLIAMSSNLLWRLVDVQRGISIRLPFTSYFGSLAFR